MALLLGGFAFNASAQTELKFNNKGKSSKVVVKNAQAKGEDLNKEITKYENAVEECLNIYNAMQTKTGQVKYTAKDFNTALEHAEALKAQIEKSKANLNRTQANRFNKATEKLLKVYQKF